MTRLASWALLLVLFETPQAWASTLPVFFDGNAGPYRLEVEIDLPDVVPGGAQVQVHSPDADITRLRLLALPIDNQQPAYPPVPEPAGREAGQTTIFMGQSWLMTSGSWEVRLLVEGARGDGMLAVPVAALPTHVAAMPPLLGLVLVALLLVLALGMVGIAAAAVREGRLGKGEQPTSTDRRGARVAGWVTAGTMLAIVLLGGLWWSASERAYARSIYRPLALGAELEPGGQKLTLGLSDPGWLPTRKLDDLVDWHGLRQGHLMDLWVVEIPSFEHVWHLHPARTGSGQFEQTLPAMNAGRYALFATVVHSDGLTETGRSDVTLPAVSGAPLGADDATGQGGPLGSAEAAVAALPNGGRMRLEASGPPIVGKPARLRFQVEDRHEGEPALDLESMDGRHADGIVVSSDRMSFEALSSRGTVAPAAWAIANPDAGEGPEPASAGFALDCEFPQAGRYRMFVEIRRGGHAEIAFFDFRAF